MRLFGLNFSITKAKADNRGKLLKNVLWPWQYGDELSIDDDFQSFMNAYRGWVYVAASKNSVSVASTPVRLYVAKDSTRPIKSHQTKRITKETENYLLKNPGIVNLKQVKKATEIEEVLDHPLLDLFRNVNSFMNPFYLFELTELYQELCGNAYWYIVNNKLGIPGEIWPVPPQFMKIIPDKNNFIKEYMFAKGMEEEAFHEEKIIHFKFASPDSLYYGKGPLAAAVAPYNISQNINRYENAVFQNMGRLEGAFETEQDLSQYEFDRLKEEIKQTFRGVKNTGKSPLLEKGVKYKNYGLAPRDLSFMQGRKAVKEEIVNIFGQSLGLYDKDATRANAQVASMTFMRDTIRPRLIRMEQKLNEKLLPRYDEKLFVAFDDPVPVDRELRLKEIETHLKSGYGSINEERLVDNLEDVDWGDIPLINTNMAPLGSNQEEDTSTQGDALLGVTFEEGMGKLSEGVADEVIKRLKTNGGETDGSDYKENSFKG